MEKKSSKLNSLCNGSASSEKKLATTESRNGSYTDPTGRRKSKRFKVDAVCELPPDSSTRLRSRTVPKKVPAETYKNRDVVGEDCVPSSEAKAELIPGRNVLDHLKPVDEKSESHQVNMREQIKDRNLPENTSELNMVDDVVEVQPVSICLPEEDENTVCASQDVMTGSVFGQSIVGTKQLRGRTITVVRDFPPNKGSKFLKSGKTFNVAISMEEKNLDLEKSDSGDHLGQSLGKGISAEVLVPLEPEKTEVTVSKPNEALGRRTTRNGVAMPSHLNFSKKINGDCGEGTRRKDSKRVDLEASKILKSKGKYVNTSTPIIGPVPGVEVGDEFQYRMELNLVGIHRPSQSGIDYMRDANEELVATSIVASGGYDDELDNSDVLTYTGQGGNVLKGKKNSEPKDQQLVKGNLALANSKDKQNPVRVIRGNKKTPLETSAVAKTYVYDGLYLVEEFWKETGSHGKLVFKFKLRRIPGQPKLSWKVVKKSKTSKVRDGLCCDDISNGKERLPIPAVNDLDDDKPPPFIYTVKMIYPDWCRPLPPRGCGCTESCSESKNCACIAKNSGELPYNYDGDIIRAKPLVYECGPLCKCPPSCYLRVTQSGIKFQLEIFKTESRGWGVRSLDSLPCGSFICEYTGELLEEKEAERLAGKDEYLFDIGKDHETSGFTIDAARKGNIGRFINHSCTPNLYAQDVLYDHEETRIPHVMFFAMRDIPPLKELSYDYNYKIDQVRDSNGNIRKKNCYCGSSKCTGRLY